LEIKGDYYGGREIRRNIWRRSKPLRNSFARDGTILQTLLPIKTRTPISKD